jgi:hypothetical protein
MPGFSERRLGGASIVAASVLLCSYGTFFPFALPAIRSPLDYSRAVLSPWWVPLTAAAFLGVLLMLAGLDALHQRGHPPSGFAWTGRTILKLALIFQACRLTWELFVDPVLAGHPQAAFLLRDAVIFNDGAVTVFRQISAIALVAGVVLFGITLYRSGLLPRRAASLIAAGVLLYAVGPMLSPLAAVAGVIMLSIGCGLVGFRIWRDAADPVQRA